VSDFEKIKWWFKEKKIEKLYTLHEIWNKTDQSFQDSFFNLNENEKELS